MTPFHWAFLVSDLASTRRFYGDILGCREGRSTDTWVDFELYGHQLSAHLSADPPAVSWCGHVDGVTVPIPHVGCILSWDDFQSLAQRLQEASIEFLIPPTVRYAGRPEEQSTMFFLDFSGNALEMKSFRHPQHIFTP